LAAEILLTPKWCFTVEDSEKVDQTEIIGSKGKISFSFFEPKPIQVTCGKQTKTIKVDYPRHVQQPLIDSVVKDIFNNDICVS
jgi:hypothetical protein